MPPRQLKPGPLELQRTLARRCARQLLRHLPASIERDDLEQEAVIALWLLGDQPEHIQRRRARFAMIDYLRLLDPLSRGERQRVKHGQAEAVHHEAGEASLEVLVDDAPEPGQQLDARRAIQRLRAAPISARLLACYVGGELTVAELAQEMSVTSARISQLWAALCKQSHTSP